MHLHFSLTSMYDYLCHADVINLECEHKLSVLFVRSQTVVTLLRPLHHYFITGYCASSRLEHYSVAMTGSAVLQRAYASVA
jgi:hypothetical protein